MGQYESALKNKNDLDAACPFSLPLLQNFANCGSKTLGFVRSLFDLQRISHHTLQETIQPACMSPKLNCKYDNPMCGRFPRKLTFDTNRPGKACTLWRIDTNNSLNVPRETKMLPALTVNSVTTTRIPDKSGTRPVERGRLACRSKPHLDQSQPPVFFFGRGLTGLRSERMDRHVRVLHQPGPLRSRINQVDGVKPVFCSYETAQEH